MDCCLVVLLFVPGGSKSRLIAEGSSAFPYVQGGKSLTSKLSFTAVQKAAKVLQHCRLAGVLPLQKTRNWKEEGFWGNGSKRTKG